MRGLLVAAGLWVLGSAAAWSQIVDPSRLAETARPPAVPSLLDDPNDVGMSIEDDTQFAPGTPGDGDMGDQMILRDARRARWLYFQADAFGYWTDNPANLSVGEEDDFFWGGRVTFGAQPRLWQTLYLDTYVNQQLYRYDRFGVLDYEYFEGGLGAIYLEPRLWNMTFFLHGIYNRMSNDDFSNTIYDSWSARAGLQKSFVFDRKNSLHANLMGDWDLETSAFQVERFEYIADLSYNYKIMRDLIFALSYRFTYFDYQKIDRHDSFNLVGASVTWAPKKWLDVYFAANFSHNNSNLDLFDYEATNIGGGLGVRIRF